MVRGVNKERGAVVSSRSETLTGIGVLKNYYEFGGLKVERGLSNRHAR